MGRAKQLGFIHLRERLLRRLPTDASVTLPPSILVTLDPYRVGEFHRAPMTPQADPAELEFAALLSSKICHDVINPVGAIHNGLEILDEDKDGESQRYALDMIRNVTAQASAKLQFARYAYGSAGSAGAVLDLGMAEQVARGFVGQGKHRLHWTGPQGVMAKDKVKLLLNLVAISMTALPRGGDIVVAVTGTNEIPTFGVRCQGTSARPPQFLSDLVAGREAPLDSMTIQAHYTWRLASTSRMLVDIVKDGDDVVLIARPAIT
jgi:histidine phosphotransferase ChpT